MQVINYNKLNERINLEKTKLMNNMVYEILKKYVANIKLENM